MHLHTHVQHEHDFEKVFSSRCRHYGLNSVFHRSTFSCNDPTSPPLVSLESVLILCWVREKRAGHLAIADPSLLTDGASPLSLSLVLGLWNGSGAFVLGVEEVLVFMLV